MVLRWPTTVVRYCDLDGIDTVNKKYRGSTVVPRYRPTLISPNVAWLRGNTGGRGISEIGRKRRCDAVISTRFGMEIDC